MLNRVLGAAVLALAAGSGMPALGYQPPRITANASKKQRRGMFNGRFYGYHAWTYPKKDSIGMAQQKRTAAKKRNQRRHKAASRG